MVLHRLKVITLVPVLALAFLLAGCFNPLIKKPLDESLVGKVHVEKVVVQKSPAINSVEIVRRVQQALVEKTAADLNIGRPVEMHVTINRYRGPENQIGGVLGTRLLGNKMEIRARVKIVDSTNGKLLAEYDAISDQTKSALEVDFTHGPYDRLVGGLTYWAMAPIT
jgi:hypothetical protein